MNEHRNIRLDFFFFFFTKVVYCLFFSVSFCGVNHLRHSFVCVCVWCVHRRETFSGQNCRRCAELQLEKQCALFVLPCVKKNYLFHTVGHCWFCSEHSKKFVEELYSAEWKLKCSVTSGTKKKKKAVVTLSASFVYRKNMPCIDTARRFVRGRPSLGFSVNLKSVLKWTRHLRGLDGTFVVTISTKRRSVLGICSV